jgi:pimeloyl-ACP methyl ester carboxylesterase
MTDRGVNLPDGRTLAYREYGNPHGAPVVNCHGGLLSGRDVAPLDATARDLGLRLVSPDRPGLGASASSPTRTTADWAGDVRALLDALGIERASVFGWSMGVQYALACAAGLADRVERVVVVAGCLPLDDDATFDQLNAMDRRLTRVARHHPHVARDVFRSLGEIARHRPDAWAHLTARGAVPEEGEALAALPDPGIASAAAHALEHGDGMVEEYVAWARPWGFAPEEVSVPVTLHQGTDDDLVPTAWAQTLANRIPGARLEQHDGAGHFLTYTEPRCVLREFADG